MNSADKLLLESQSVNLVDAVHAIISRKCIVDFGIIKKIVYVKSSR